MALGEAIGLGEAVGGGGCSTGERAQAAHHKQDRHTSMSKALCPCVRPLVIVWGPLQSSLITWCRIEIDGVLPALGTVKQDCACFGTTRATSS